MATIKEILSLVETGELSYTDAEKLLTQVDTIAKSRPSHEREQSTWCIVTITNPTNGRVRARTRLPITLIPTALRMNAHFIPAPDKQLFDEQLNDIQKQPAGTIITYQSHLWNEMIQIDVE